MSISRDAMLDLVRDIAKEDAGLLGKLVGRCNTQNPRLVAIKSDAGFWSINFDWTNDPALIMWMAREPFYMPVGKNLHFIPKPRT